MANIERISSLINTLSKAKAEKDHFTLMGFEMGMTKLIQKYLQEDPVFLRCYPKSCDFSVSSHDMINSEFKLMFNNSRQFAFMADYLEISFEDALMLLHPCYNRTTYNKTLSKLGFSDVINALQNIIDD